MPNNQPFVFIDEFCKTIIHFKGTLVEAQTQLKEFIAKIFIEIFHVEQNNHVKIFHSLLKYFDTVMKNVTSYFQSIAHPYRLDQSIPIKKIFANRNILDEGFSSSEEELKPITLSPPKFKRAITTEISMSTSQNFDLSEKLKERDEIIEKMTIGYLKDVQHLREMFVRKDMYPEEEIFDVNFYDYTKTLDPTVKEFLKGKIFELTNQFRIQIQRYCETITDRNREIEKLKGTIRQIAGGSDVHSILRQLLFLEKDLNKIWRGIQDCIGNKAIFDIFEKRKAGYGIDYQQIDQCIAHSSAQNRIFQQFKDNLDQQMINFTTAASKEIKFMQTNINELKEEIRDLKGIKETDLIQIRQSIKLGIDNIMQIKLQTIKDKYAGYLSEIMENPYTKKPIEIIKFSLQRAALYKWIYIAKCRKLNIVGSIKLNRKALSVEKMKPKLIQDLIDQELINNRKEIKEIQQNLVEEQLIQSETSIQLRILQNKFQSLTHDYEMQRQKLHYQKQHILQLENITNYYDRIYRMIMSKIGYSNLEVSLKNSKFVLDKADESIKIFNEKLDSIKVDDFQNIKEATLYLIKRQLVHNKLFRDITADASTITDIYRVDYEFTNYQQITELDQIEEQQLQDTQNDQNNEISLSLQSDQQNNDQENKNDDDDGDDEDDDDNEFHYIQKDKKTEKKQSKRRSSKLSSPQARKSVILNNNNISMMHSREYSMNKSVMLGRSQRIPKLITIGTQTDIQINQWGQYKNSIEQQNQFNQMVKDNLESMLSEAQKNNYNDKSRNASQQANFRNQRPAALRQQTFASLLSQQNVQKLQIQRLHSSVRNRSPHYLTIVNNLSANQKLKTENNDPKSLKKSNITFSIEKAQIVISNKQMFMSAKCTNNQSQSNSRYRSKSKAQ